MTTSAMDDLARADGLLSRFEASAGGNHSAMCAAAQAIAQAGGSGGPEFVLTAMTQGGRNIDDILSGPWRWLREVAVEASRQHNRTLVARIAWFTRFWSEHVLPTMVRNEVLDTGLVNAPDAIRAEVAELGLAALADIDRSAVLARDSTGSVLVVEQAVREFAQELDRARAHRVTADAAPSVPAPRAAQPTTNPVSAGQQPATADLSILFRRDASNADRVKVIREFTTTARARLQGASSAAGRGSDLMAERAGELLSEAVVRLPFRTADDLRRDYGADPEAQARQVIDDAARLAGWLWTAAAAVPAPPAVVHAVKVVLHSTIEIRMVGELYAIFGDRFPQRDATWLGAVLVAWASRQPLAPGGTVTSGAVVLVSRVRQSITELVGNDSRLARLGNRGREGSSSMRRLGGQMHRRMRLHPSTWARPGADSAGTVLGGLARMRLEARVPASMLALARVADPRAGAPAPALAAASATAVTAREAMERAWALHRLAVGASAVSPPDEVGARLRACLAAQAAHLNELAARLRQAPPPAAARQGGDAVVGSAYAWEAEAAIDAALVCGERPRRLSAWSSRGRAALVYLLTATVVATPAAAAIWTSSGVLSAAFLAIQCLILPWFSLTIGAVAIGPLFRPWLGGPVSRHPIVGSFVTLAIHVGFGLLAAVLSALLSPGP